VHDQKDRKGKTDHDDRKPSHGAFSRSEPSFSQVIYYTIQLWQLMAQPIDDPAMRASGARWAD
jgi:hypothetical protein